eukprot:CAMPEP_0174712756 /NCGR_PEP_ID=MMETSP1094-20130205/13653_1 /TAXON_ID=156173 /ORGANISM="Chrysochromulina brevifilum, Strain UTEX LB 985" /LENGTH=306 /DNA_ID=CAMNT_0015911857 /DNA_START=1 /DNA_END=921 /DNA_ORIENTATION=+
MGCSSSRDMATKRTHLFSSNSMGEMGTASGVGVSILPSRMPAAPENSLVQWSPEQQKASADLQDAVAFELHKMRQDKVHKKEEAAADLQDKLKHFLDHKHAKERQYASMSVEEKKVAEFQDRVNLHLHQVHLRERENALAAADLQDKVAHVLEHKHRLDAKKAGQQGGVAAGPEESRAVRFPDTAEFQDRVAAKLMEVRQHTQARQMAAGELQDRVAAVLAHKHKLEATSKAKSQRDIAIQPAAPHADSEPEDATDDVPMDNHLPMPDDGLSRSSGMVAAKGTAQRTKSSRRRVDTKDSSTKPAMV